MIATMNAAAEIQRYFNNLNCLNDNIPFQHAYSFYKGNVIIYKVTRVDNV